MRFSFDLKVGHDSSPLRRLAGKLFQALGPATLKPRPPTLAVRKTTEYVAKVEKIFISPIS